LERESKIFPESALSTIRILSEHLANQIAAGEVIERPASVVKEFIENAIDAGARHIAIQVEGDGTRLIRVIDDGVGMDQDDVLLCLERHATSKISDSIAGNNQLGHIVTLGFRGEAIPSIASVSRLVITSRPADAPLGSQVEVRYGRVTKVHEAGCRRGTVMEMRDLFGNLPARKKFLKTRRTELTHIEDVVKNACLALPQLGISYQVDGKPVFDLPAATDTLEDRVRWFLGRRQAEPLLRIDSSTLPPGETLGANDLSAIAGFLLPPEESYGPTAKLKVFVNNRAVRDRMIVHGVSEGLAGFLMKGRTPAGALFVNIAVEAVDVNVHPTKQEVRFHRPQSIRHLVVQTVRSAMEKYQDAIKYSLFGTPRARSVDRQVGANSPPEHTGPLPGIFPGSAVAEPISHFDAGGDPVTSGKPEEMKAAPVAVRKGNATPGTGSEDHQRSGMRTDRTAERTKTLPGSGSDLGVLVPIGQLMNLYLLCENRDGEEEALVIIDQHAAHERLVFETLKRQFTAQRVASQVLLFPQLINLTPDQIQVLQRHRLEVERLGIDTEEFGEESYIVKAVPAILAHLSPEEIMAAVIGQFQDSDQQSAGRAMNTAARIDDILSAMACKAAVKAGRSLAAEEIEELLNQMRKADVFSHCPHGRPVFKTFTATEVRKWFHRT
jgi:DNA mismatch repair protein MutL